MRVSPHASGAGVTRKGPGRPATGKVRKGTSVSLSADEKARLARWGETLSAAVRRVLAVAEAAEQRGDALP
jgi:hypothetical protein